jgi:hypothetical protein
MNYRAHNITVGIQQSAGRYGPKYITMRFGSENTVSMDLDEAIQVAQRLNAFVNLVSTPQRRRKVVKA